MTPTVAISLCGRKVGPGQPLFVLAALDDARSRDQKEIAGQIEAELRNRIPHTIHFMAR